MKKHLTRFFYLMFIVFGTGTIAVAQFNQDSSQTYFVCNATGSQLGVSAFADGNGGTYSFWSDKRNGTAGTAIYGQHMDSLGVPQWAATGKLFFQQNAKEVWIMKAVAWQSGILISWIQGGFGIGGDTLFCNYYNSNGVSQWAQPTVVANKQASIIYVSFDNLDIYPNDSGATITFGLTPSGGNTYFSFNRIDFSGNLVWPLDSKSYQGNGFYYTTADDQHNGFFVATTTGGLGYHYYLSHFDLQGNLTNASPVDVCGTAGGRGNSQPILLCDADTNAYLVWASSTNSDISISKFKANGTLPWPDARQICAAAGYQENPDAIIKGDTIYATWNDGRPGVTGNADVYMQKLDTSGTGIWTTDGILLSHLSSYIPYPKLAVSGNTIVAAYVVSGGFHGQRIRANGTTVWYTNGIVVNVNNPPFYGDFKLLSAADGAVTAIWRESADNICAARIRPAGTLTYIMEPEAISFQLFPNPVSDELYVTGNSFHGKAVSIKIYTAEGALVYSSVDKNVPGVFSKSISLKEFTAGVYVVQLESGTIHETHKLLVDK